MQIKVKKKDGNPDADMDMILNKAKHEMDSDHLKVSQHTEGDEVVFKIKAV